MQPDLTDHVGPITIDTYVDGAVLLYYADGVLIGRDCGNGTLERASGLGGNEGRYLSQAAAEHEGSV